MKKIVVCFIYLSIFQSFSLCAEEVNIAVASNFKYTLQQLVAGFKVKTGFDVRISSASSGKLFAQIIHGAPYDVFFSADEKYADLLISEKIASENSAYVYALGRLVFISNIINKDECKEVLNSQRLRRLAIANPEIAPYGLAARQVLDKLELWQQLQPRIVRGENISQTFQFVSTKNADAGFVANSMLNMGKQIDYACLWHVPADLYSPIKQKMVVLNTAKNIKSVQAFVQYIQSVEAKETIRAMGYNVL